MTIEHEDDTQHGRFFVRAGDEDAELAYTHAGPRVIDIQHTYVPESARGHGLAEQLATAAFAYAREQGYRVIPSCPFVRSWLRSHPDEAALLDAPYAETLGRRSPA